MAGDETNQPQGGLIRQGIPLTLRYLFARVYYSQERIWYRLADILDNSSVNTTRIYTMESGENHLRQLREMNLLIDRSIESPFVVNAGALLRIIILLFGTYAI